MVCPGKSSFLAPELPMNLLVYHVVQPGLSIPNALQDMPEH